MTALAWIAILCWHRRAVAEGVRRANMRLGIAKVLRGFYGA